MKIIFLDVDGVLNTRYSRCRTADGFIGILQTKVMLLRKIVEQTGASIVVSSSWRSNPRSLEWLRKSLLSEQLTFIDTTPDYRYQRPRGLEVQEWLDNYKTLNGEDIENFVILDDTDEFSQFKNLKPHYVQTDYYDRALHWTKVQEAINILNKTS